MCRSWSATAGSVEPTDERLPLLRRALGAGNKNANVYLASPQNAANLFDAVAGRPTVFARELGQFLDAGYKQVGNYLIR